VSPQPIVITTSEALTASVGQDLGLFGGDVDAFLGHGTNSHRVDLVGRFGPSRADLYAITSEVVEVSGSHLGTAGVVDTDEEDGRLVGHELLLGVRC